MSIYFVQPLIIWEDQQFYKVGPVADPQEKGRSFALFPKSHPNSKTHAALFKQILTKWHNENKEK